jgi:hypothetical protein
MSSQSIASPSECIYKHLKKEPLLDDNLIVALMANIAIETGYTFDYKTVQRGERSDPAYGLFQLDPRGGLYDLYIDYLDYSKSDDSAESQLNMMVDILLRQWDKGVAHVGHGNVNKVLAAAEKSAEEATRAFCDHILRPGKPHMERRLAAIVGVNKSISTINDIA